MTEIPNLAGVATKDLVEQIGSSKFSASYINWARTIHLLHQHAPGWMVNYVTSTDGGLVHKAPGIGGYLLIGFEHISGTATPPLPQAVMDIGTIRFLLTRSLRVTSPIRSVEVCAWPLQ